MRETTVALYEDTNPRRKLEPQDMGTPAMWMLSLMASVLPDSWPWSAPAIFVNQALTQYITFCLSCHAFFTALHGMQSRYSDGNSVRPSVRPSVCLSVKGVHCDKTEESYV